MASTPPSSIPMASITTQTNESQIHVSIQISFQSWRSASTHVPLVPQTQHVPPPPWTHLHPFAWATLSSRTLLQNSRTPPGLFITLGYKFHSAPSNPNQKSNSLCPAPLQMTHHKSLLLPPAFPLCQVLLERTPSTFKPISTLLQVFPLTASIRTL